MLSLVIHTSNYHYRKKLPRPATAETEVNLSVLAIVFSKRISKKTTWKSNNILENKSFHRRRSQRNNSFTKKFILRVRGDRILLWYCCNSKLKTLCYYLKELIITKKNLWFCGKFALNSLSVTNLLMKSEIACN